MLFLRFFVQKCIFGAKISYESCILGLKFLAPKFCTKIACKRRWWNWHLLRCASKLFYLCCITITLCVCTTKLRKIVIFIKHVATLEINLLCGPKILTLFIVLHFTIVVLLTYEGFFFLTKERFRQVWHHQSQKTVLCLIKSLHVWDPCFFVTWPSWPIKGTAVMYMSLRPLLFCRFVTWPISDTCGWDSCFLPFCKLTYYISVTCDWDPIFYLFVSWLISQRKSPSHKPHTCDVWSKSLHRMWHCMWRTLLRFVWQDWSVTSRQCHANKSKTLTIDNSLFSEI